VDSGANIGQMTLSLLPFERVTIHAFEPTRSAGDWLESCVRANALRNVRLVRYGLSSRPAKAPIQLNGPRSTLNLDWYRDHGLQTETVDLIPLDDYLNQAGISRVRLWKLDVEGHEPDALSGASQALERRAIDAILVEVSESTLDEVKALLGQCGYGMHSISSDGLTQPLTSDVKRTCNLVALPSS
jgi:FkbM family methyltransferase